MARNAKKGKFLIFRFWRCQGLRDEVPNVLRFLNEIEKRSKRAIKNLMEVQATISRTDLTKLQKLGSIIFCYRSLSIEPVLCGI